jgi:ATP-dependent Clp protease ATP-binding subunit ClpC
VFERFTEPARQVVVLAQDEARALNHNYIGTEHILLGLLRQEESLAASVLESLDVKLEDVRAQVAHIVGWGEEVTTGQIPFTPRAKKTLELSLREAVSLGQKFIGTEHILLGLVRENDGVAARILFELGADADTIRNQVIRMLSGPTRLSVERQAQKSESDEATASAANPELAAELQRVRREKEAALESQDFERAVALRKEERRVRRKLLGLAEGQPGIDLWEDLPEESTRRTDVLRLVRSHPRRQPFEGLPGLLIGWLLFGVALGIGVLVGWLIWG